MKFRSVLLAIVIMGLWSMAALAAGPIASPEGIASEIRPQELPIPASKLSSTPGDFLAGALAGADYVRYMQSDVTEDNAGNGDPDQDLEDAGWDWVTTAFEHSASASSSNLYGVTANAMFQAYQIAPTAELFTAMEDAANFIIISGPVDIRSASDVTFLLNFSTISNNPIFYRGGGEIIWQHHLTNYGTATVFGETLRDSRGASYPNGIIAWDVGLWVKAVQQLSDAFGGLYDTDADDIAEVLYQDSFALLPGYFDVHGANKGAVDDYSDIRYYWYTLGVTGLIDAFMAADVHTAEIPALEAVLLECQYDWGAFSFQYGANENFNDAGDQDTAYACMTMANLAPTPTNLNSLYNGAFVLSSWQDDASGGQVYGDGSHYPEVSAECAAAMAAAWNNFGSAITASVAGDDPAQCGVENVVTFNYAPMSGTAGLRGYELTLEVIGPVETIVEADFADAGMFSSFGTHYFRAIDNGDGTWTVNDAILGATGGLLTAADMFELTLTTNGDGAVDVNVLSYKLRDPDNADIYADVSGAGFIVDCTAPGSVDTFVGAPGHEKADLEWTMADISDVAGFEIWRSVWYDGDNAYVSAYPEYDDLANDMDPTRPATRAAALASGEWTLVHTAAAGDVAHTDVVVPRGVYYYEIFAFDTAGNYGTPAVDQVWVMNYWLGDVSDGVYAQFDGLVDVADITSLGSYFGLTNIGLNHAGNHVDVGPTHDNSRLGIPSTDDAVDFEDLMIFAMNYNLVSAAKSESTPGSIAYLAWSQMEDGRYVVRVNQANGMQGLHISGNVKVTAVTAGELIAQQDEMTFLKNVGTNLDANVAIMGLDNSFVGDGDLLIINASGSIDFADLVFDARGSDNSSMEVSFEQASGALMPSVFSLESNYPNPFNPMTKISFSLPEAQAVKLAVYSLDGRKIATLINEQRSAGTYEVNWMGVNDNGQTVASGTYFYRIDAGPYSQVRKMTLMK